MGSHDDGELNPLLLEPKRNACFFHIILEEKPGEGIVIPRKFANTYENDLLHEVSLEVPTGAVWKVELVKCDDRLWLRNGWRDFQEYYSIRYGTFLMFEYTSRSYFRVVICDQSAAEIDYPSSVFEDCEEPKFEGDDDEAQTERSGGDNKSMEILTDCSRSSKKRKNLAFQCPQPPKMGRTSSTLKSQAKGVDENVSSCKHGKSRISNDKKALGIDETAEAFHRASGSFEIQECTALSLIASAEAAGLKDENPSFFIVMKPSYIKRHSTAVIPIKFARNHLRQRRAKCILQISRRKSWNVYFRACGSKVRKVRFSTGWYAFVRDNNLGLGDVCVFELIDRVKLILKVVIHRASRGKIPLKSKEKFLLPCPCPACKTTAELDSSLELHNVAPVNHQLSCMKVDNPTGDMNLSDPELKSEDTRKEKGSSDHKHKVRGKKVKERSLSDDEKAKAISKAGGAFKSANPFFMIAMQPAYTRLQLSLPFDFAKSHFKEENAEVVLQVSDGRSWTVDYTMKSGKRRARFLCSWATFVRDNNLAVGDVCIFELIESSKLVFKVTISRADDAHPSSGSMDNSRGDVNEIEFDSTPDIDKAEATCSPNGNSSGKITVYEEKPGSGLPESPSVYDSRGDVKEIEFASTPDIDKAEATCSRDDNSSGKITVYEEKPVSGLPESPLCAWVPKVVEAAENFTSMYPCFKVFMEISNLKGKVTVPAKFMKFIKQGQEKALKIRLLVGDNTWPVKLSRKCKIGKMTFGWNVFSEANQLQVGDCCVFELVDSKSWQFKVSILRHKD